MSKFQVVSVTELKEMLERRNLWSRMHSGKFLAVERNRAAASKAAGGTSYIISYYDNHLQYVCTIHKIEDNNGHVIHEHVKDAYINGVRYKGQ
jgi:hypothetical protein